MARLEWKGDVLTLGGVPLYLGIAEYEDANWEAYGDSVFRDLLRKQWKRREDATADCETEVRRMLKDAGVNVDG